MNKRVGVFLGSVSEAYPCWCSITDETGNEIRFNHNQLSDLEYLVTQMKKAAIEKLPEGMKEQV